MHVAAGCLAMRAKDLMTRDVVTVDKDERLETVLQTMQKQRMSKLVVLEKGRIAGVVTDGDIADELGAIKNRGVSTSHLHASSAMRRVYPAVEPDTPLARVLEELLHDGAGLLPVAHDGSVVGVVTASDLLKLVESVKPVSDVMTSQLVVVQPTDRVIHARRLMMDHHVERLPVLDHGKLVGIVGEGDIASGLARFKSTVRDNHQPAALQRFLVEDVMQRTVITTTPETTAKAAAAQMRSEDVGSLPVVRGDRVVGIVTRTDLLKLIVPK